ncbi:MAG: hypothetical protein KA035_00180 [Candidatus Levybacteria bacterium]|nr:hypothetical protein [Candidatus Levybacteria bacterium]
MSDSLTDIKDSFIEELVLANAGKPSSLPFIVHEMPEFSLVSEGEVFQVIIIGGTFSISAIVQKNAKSCSVVSQNASTLPGFVNKEDFFLFIEQTVDESVQAIALNFAFPIIPVFENGKLDGKLLRGTKGHTFRGVVGSKIGHVIEEFMWEKKKKKIQVSVANDTVCLLLSGLEKAPWEKLGAGIVGSGMNFAFYLDQNRLVNLESADFDKFDQSTTGVEIDRDSANPGKSKYEKEVAGIYLYKHYNLLLRSKNITSPSVKTTQELDLIARESSSEEHKIAKELLERSAKLISCQMAAIMEYRKTDMVFVMEGSLFWKGYEYKKTVEETLKELTSYKAEFVEVKDSGIIGAAHLVM